MKKNFTKQDFYALLKPGGPNGDCLEWTGGTNSGGYGRRWYNGKSYLSHRLILILEGYCVTNKTVLHKCDNPLCCNINHLTIGTQTDNMVDMLQKGRGSTPPLLNGTKHPNSKLTDSDIIEIRSKIKMGHTNTSIASDYGVNPSLISAIKTRKTWKHIP